MNLVRKKLSSLKRWFLFEKKRAAYRAKIKYVYKIADKTTINLNLKTTYKSYANKWKNLYPVVDLKWYRTYSEASGRRNLNYVPEDFYYGIIEPILNDNNFSTAYADKNFYNRYYSESNIFPETLLKNIHGAYFDEDFNYIQDFENIKKHLKNVPTVIIKPSIDSWGGRNVSVFNLNENEYYNKSGEKFTFDYLDKNYSQNFVVQKYINQSEFFKNLNPTSLNTMRVYTYRSVKTNEVIVCNATVRMGQKDSNVDNLSSGGVACILDDNGYFSEYAIDYYGKKVYNLPSNPTVKFTDIGKVPNFEEIKKVAKEIGLKNKYHRVLGFDFCVDENENIRIIEINNRRIDINIFQLFGYPLFGKYTDEIIEYCSKKIKEGYRYTI